MLFIDYQESSNSQQKQNKFSLIPGMINTADPPISILMTVYNREKYISEAIYSVLQSSYQNWELIIVDDRSSDRSVEIARQFEKEDDRIKVYINEMNLGDYPNRMKAASYARGKYLKYLDSDDTIQPQGLEIMVNAMEQFPDAGVGFSSSNYKSTSFPVSLSSKESIRYHFFEKIILSVGPSAAIYNHHFFKQIKGFENYGVASDYAFNLKATLLKPIVILKPGLIHWRRHDDQEIRKHEEDYMKMNHKIYCDYIFYTENLPTNQRREIRNNYKAVTGRKFLRKILTGDLNSAIKTAKATNLKFTDSINIFSPRKIRKYL